jgi:hypothetical protein
VNLNTYKATLYLVAIIALIETILTFYFTPGNFSLVGVTLAVLFGLWVQSKATRYLGAVWFLVLVGLIVWPLFTTGNVIFSPALIPLVFWGALCLIVSYILAFSKTFAAEFLHQKEAQPAYKRTLAKAFIIIVILIVVILTLNDIYHLFLA